MIRVKCPKPNCHNHTQVNEIFIGRPVRCSKCGTSFIIKNPSPVPRPAPSPAAPLPLAALAETAPASLTGPPALENLAFTSEPISVPEWAEIEVAATEFTEEGAFTGQAGTKPTEAEVTEERGLVCASLAGKLCPGAALRGNRDDGSVFGGRRGGHRKGRKRKPPATRRTRKIGMKSDQPTRTDARQKEENTMTAFDAKAHLRAMTERGAKHLTNNLNALAQDKRNECPAGCAHTPLFMVAECGGVNGMVAKMLSGETLDFPSQDERTALLKSFDTTEKALAFLIAGDGRPACRH